MSNVRFCYIIKVSPHSRDGSPALQRKAGLQDLDGLDKPAATIEQEGYRDQITVRLTLSFVPHSLVQL